MRAATGLSTAPDERRRAAGSRQRQFGVTSFDVDPPPVLQEVGDLERWVVDRPGEAVAQLLGERGFA